MQFSPSNKVYAQAWEKVRALTRRYSSLKTRDVDEFAEEVAKTLKEIAEETNGPTLVYREIEHGELPSSFRMNKFLQSLAYDINIILDEMNILKAASVHTHNFIKTELLKAGSENERLHNKIKTLQLYSSSEDSSIVYAGDFFYNDEYIDWELTPTNSRIELIKGDQITLGISSQVQLIDTSAIVTIESGSNGFVGNNHQVIPDIPAAPIFFTQENITSSFLTRTKDILDQKPDSYFEFEKYYVGEVDRVIKAKNLNFEYRFTGSSDYGYLENFVGQKGQINWANNQDHLKLNFVIDLKNIQTINKIQFSPFGFTDNKNAPIIIKKASVSPDRSNWTILEPQNLWIANGIDQNSINLDGENIVINTANYSLDGESARYIRFEIEQPTPMQVDIGHFYYIDPSKPVSDGAEPERFEGPIPPVDRIWQEKEPSSSYQNNLIQRRERFSGKRWAIGIRDIGAFTTTYSQTSSMISKRFYVPGGVDRVALEADVLLPISFSRDAAWVRFYVSPDDGNSWYQISRIQDDFLNIPEIIAFNDNAPIELRLPGVRYVETSGTPTSLRVKIEMDRATGDDTQTPIVKSYNLKIKQRTVK